MNYLARVASRVIGRPLLVTPEKAEVILAVLEERIGLDGLFEPQREANRFAGKASERGPYSVTKEGIALVPVIGTLVNRGAYIGASSGLTSYEGLTEQLKKADKDTSVRGILLDIDSPGGEAGGCFDLAAMIRDIRGRKPVVCMVNDMACSAAYALAASCSQIFMTSTGMVGSIGVIVVHFDRSGALEQAGIKPTIIKSGSRKADLNPFEPLSKDVRERLQGEIDTMRDLFIETVVQGRPKLKAAALKGMEAGVFMGESAIEAGLADGLSTFDRVLEVMSSQMGRLISTPAGYNPKPKENAMSEPVAPAASAPDPAALEAARSAAAREAKTAEKVRIGAILKLPEAEGRAALALELATETDLSAADAQKLLAKAPKEAAASSTTKLYDAIALQGGNPKVRAGGQSDEPSSRAADNIARQTTRLAKRR